MTKIKSIFFLCKFPSDNRAKNFFVKKCFIC